MKMRKENDFLATKRNLKMARKELLSRINQIYYWRLLCETHEPYKYLQLINFNTIGAMEQHTF
jgi:hypothetical protein